MVLGRIGSQKSLTHGGVPRSMFGIRPSTEEMLPVPSPATHERESEPR